MIESEPTAGAVSPTTRRFPAPPPIRPEKGLTPGQWGMIAFLVSEVSFFSTLIVTYIVFYGRDSQPGGSGGPTPAGVLSLPLVIGTTLCLISSSVTVHMAERWLHESKSLFLQLWGATIGLGVLFLLGTMHEWTELISRGLTISRNLFGTTFYTLVGFHALHVTVGVIVMSIVLGLAIRGALGNKKQAVQLVAWYWHFVDAVWLVVFTVVYIVPRAA